MSATILPNVRLQQWAAVCFSARCLHLASRRYSVARTFLVDSERARLLTSFYYQVAIDKAANKVRQFYGAYLAVSTASM